VEKRQDRANPRSIRVLISFSNQNLSPAVYNGKILTVFGSRMNLTLVTASTYLSTLPIFLKLERTRKIPLGLAVLLLDSYHRN
jgi:hypothetical protein